MGNGRIRSEGVRPNGLSGFMDAGIVSGRVLQRNLPATYRNKAMLSAEIRPFWVISMLKIGTFF
jgi:hypothetical protein